MGAGRLDGVVAAAGAVLARRPSGLFADIDGTLSRISPTPESATVSDRARSALATLAARLDLVTAVTGRGVEDARRLVRLDQIGYVGNHGLERWHDGQVLIHPEVPKYVPEIAATIQTLKDALAVPGMIFEDKGTSGSVHYRLTTDPDAAHALLLRAIGQLPSAARLRLVEGALVLNLLPPISMNKGRALAELIEANGLRGAVFLGDDVTDLDGFRALRELRQTHSLATLGIGVASPQGPPELATLADLTVSGVEDVELLLDALASSPPQEASS